MTHEELARTIAAPWLASERDGDTSEHPGDHELYQAIAAALKARDVPEGFIRDDTQTVRKVTHREAAVVPGPATEVLWVGPALTPPTEGGTR